MPENTDYGESPWRDRDVLYELYHGEDMTQAEIATELGCARQTVGSWIRKFGIETNHEFHDELRDEEWLREKYIEEGDSMYEIAERVGCDASVVFNWLDRHDIPTRSHDIAELRDGELLEKLYVGEGMSAMGVAEEIGCSECAVLHWLRRHDIEVRRSSSEKLLQPTTSKEGRVRVTASGSEQYEKVKLHRLQAMLKYGFEDVLEHDVHHKNGIPWDNRMSNLELRTHDDHARIHAESRERRPDGRFA